MKDKYQIPTNKSLNQSECFLDKIVSIQNFETKAINQYHLRVEYIASSRQINLSKIIQQIHSKGLKIWNSQIFYQNSELQMNTYLGTFPFQKNVFLKHQLCTDKILKIKYKRLSQSPKNSTVEPQKTINNQNPKYQGAQNTCSTKQRNKQRKIGEVAEIVKKWKKMSTEKDQFGNKVYTLAAAAQIIGISKKTLDDYAYQIQVGHQFNFNFQANKYQKIGILRRFVKLKRSEQAIINNTDNYWVAFANQQNQSQNSSNG